MITTIKDGYNYELEKPKLLTFGGINTFLRIERQCRLELLLSGSFSIEEITSKLKLSVTWMELACFDLLEEHQIIECISDSCVFAQHRVYKRGAKLYKA